MSLAEGLDRERARRRRRGARAPERNDAGEPLDANGEPFRIGGYARVIAVGYGATAPLTSGRVSVVSLGPIRAEVMHPSFVGTSRVAYECMRVVEGP